MGYTEGTSVTLLNGHKSFYSGEDTINPFTTLKIRIAKHAYVEYNNSHQLETTEKLDTSYCSEPFKVRE
jgi:hypothetical protein